MGLLGSKPAAVVCAGSHLFHLLPLSLLSPVKTETKLLQGNCCRESCSGVKQSVSAQARDGWRCGFLKKTWLHAAAQWSHVFPTPCFTFEVSCWNDDSLMQKLENNQLTKVHVNRPQYRSISRLSPYIRCVLDRCVNCLTQISKACLTERFSRWVELEVLWTVWTCLRNVWALEIKAAARCFTLFFMCVHNHFALAPLITIKQRAVFFLVLLSLSDYPFS